MTRNAVALSIFTALQSRMDAKIDLYPKLGEKQIRTCFALADTFIRIASERHPAADRPSVPPDHP